MDSNWHEEMNEKLSGVIVAAKLMGYNVLNLKDNKIWFSGNSNMIQVHNGGYGKVRLNYLGTRDDKEYTIEEAIKKIKELL